MLRYLRLRLHLREQEPLPLLLDTPWFSVKCQDLAAHMYIPWHVDQMSGVTHWVG
jgi:hypothetical protein